MRIFITPISGGFFPCQLGPMLLFPPPDLMLGASGGNLVNYLYSCVKRLEEKGENATLHEFIPRMEVERNNEHLLKKIARHSGDIEKLTLIHDKITKKAIVSSNRGRGESHLQLMGLFDEFSSLYGVELRFCSDSVTKIGNSIQASYSIPNIFPPVQGVGKHTDDLLEDGGVAYPSPFTPLAYSLKNLYPDQVIYFSPFDPDALPLLIQDFPKQELELTKMCFNMRAERALGIQYLLGDTFYFAKCSVEELLRDYKDKQYYAIVQPRTASLINITSFDILDVEEAMKTSTPTCECLVWFK